MKLEKSLIIRIGYPPGGKSTIVVETEEELLDAIKSGLHYNPKVTIEKVIEMVEK